MNEWEGIPHIISHSQEDTVKHILIALCAAFALASNAEASGRVHVIRKGETLSGIAKKYLGHVSAYEELARVNGIEDPDRIYAGARLLIPDAVRNEQKTARVVESRIATRIVNMRLSSLAGSTPGVHLVGTISITVSAPYLVVATLPSHLLVSSSSLLLHLPSASSSCYSSIIDEVALRVGIDSDLIRAIIRTESACNRMARSPKGALGLMQLMPDLLRFYDISDPFDASANIDAGARHLKKLIRQYKDTPLVLAAYNAGPEAVKKYGGVPPFPETHLYISRVWFWLHKFQPKE